MDTGGQGGLRQGYADLGAAARGAGEGAATREAVGAPEGSVGDADVDDARIFKAFCSECRLQVLARLRTGEKCACDLLERIDVSQSNLSHHMRVLVDSGIVRARQDGKWTYYSIDPEGVARARRRLDELTEVRQTEGPGRCCDGSAGGCGTGEGAGVTDAGGVVAGPCGCAPARGCC